MGRKRRIDRQEKMKGRRRGEMANRHGKGRDLEEGRDEKGHTCKRRVSRKRREGITSEMAKGRRRQRGRDVE